MLPNTRQVVCCERTPLLAAKPLAKGVLREYQRVHALAHSGPRWVRP